MVNLSKLELINSQLFKCSYLRSFLYGSYNNFCVYFSLQSLGQLSTWGTWLIKGHLDTQGIKTFGHLSTQGTWGTLFSRLLVDAGRKLNVHIRCSEDVLDVFWTSYSRSIYVLYLRGNSRKRSWFPRSNLLQNYLLKQTWPCFISFKDCVWKYVSLIAWFAHFNVLCLRIMNKSLTA